jgi:hypothetical protein
MPNGPDGMLQRRAGVVWLSLLLVLVIGDIGLGEGVRQADALMYEVKRSGKDAAAFRTIEAGPSGATAEPT